jgi:hypothetical protein
MKPATDYRNNPASEFCARCFEERGIFLSNKPDSNNLQAGLFGRKMPTYADWSGWVISIITGRFEAIADRNSRIQDRAATVLVDVFLRVDSFLLALKQ